MKCPEGSIETWCIKHVLKKSFLTNGNIKSQARLLKKQKTIQQHVKYYKKVLQQNNIYNDNINNII